MGMSLILHVCFVSVIMGMSLILHVCFVSVMASILDVPTIYIISDYMYNQEEYL